MISRLDSPIAAPTELRHSTSLLHPECPIEQTVRGSDPSVQAQLLQEIWRQHWFVDDGALLVAQPKCLRVLARTENGLRAPIEALRRRYGERLLVEPPSVRYAYGAPVLEPFMTVLVNGPPRHFADVQKDLARRRATIARIDRHSDAFVLEAEAPLGHLLGYRKWLDRRFEATVEVTMWLSRYCPITDDGPQAA